MPYIAIRSVAPLTAGNGTAFSKVGHAWIEISGGFKSEVQQRFDASVAFS